jgi:WD40 repeat protein/tRNA A-37 threonylcarbamoyl transferase component Bud32
MSDETALGEMLSVWEQEAARGRDLSAAELCGDRPELIPVLEERMQAIRQMNRLAHSAPPVSQITPPTNKSPTPSPASPAGDTQATVGPGDKPGLPANQVGVPGYEFIRVLGRGGMGVVYQARHRKLNRVVALKMILAGGHAGVEQEQRFLAEAEAVAHLQHRNIVQIFESGTYQRLPYFTLEYVPGGSLADKVREAPLAPGVAARIVEQMAEGMAYAHQRGVIHRDLKPDNVLLDSDGTPKITDFGLAKRISEPGMTHSGAVMGTPSYMAPEQAAGNTRAIGPLTDVYGIGAVLYRLVTGRPPFQGTTTLETMLQVSNEEAVRPTQLQPKLPRDLETIILKCLDKEPRKRYAGAASLAEDLRRFQSGEPILARPIGRAARLIKWARRKPAQAALVAVITTAAFVFLIGFALFTWQLEDERDYALDQGRIARQQTLLTASERDRANQEKKAAIDAQHTAETERTRAQLQEAETKKQLRIAQTAHYAGQIQHARRLIEDHNVGQAMRVLAECQPDLRHFEHRFLTALCERNLHSFSCHLDIVNGIATFSSSPDSPLAVTASGDKTVKIWDLASGQEIYTFQGHATTVQCVACDRRWRIASGSADGVLKIWDGAKGKMLYSVLAHPGGVRGVAFSNTGLQIATAGMDGQVKIWDANLGKLVRGWKAHQTAFSVAFTPDGKKLLSGGEDGAKLWDTTTGTEVVTLPQHKANAGSVACSADGKHLAAGYGDWKIKIWSMAGAEEHTIQDGNWIVNCVAFSPNSSNLAAGLANGPIKVYDVRTGQLLSRYGSETWDGPRCFAYTPDGIGLVAASGVYDSSTRKHVGSSVRFWSLKDPAYLEVSMLLEPRGGAVWAVAFNADGSLLAWGGDKGVIVLQEPSGRVVRILDGPKSLVNLIAFRSDAKQLISGANDGKARVWDVATGECLQTLGLEKTSIQALAYHPGGSMIATASGDKKIRLWNPATGEELRTLEGHQMQVTCVAFSKDGSILVSGSPDDTLKVWDVASGTLMQSLPAHKGVRCAVFSPDGTLLATAGNDFLVKLWEVRTWKEIRTLAGHSEPVGALAFSADGQRLASASGAFVQAGEAKIWDTASGQELLGLRGINYRLVHGLAFDPDGSRLALAGGNNFVQLLMTRNESDEIQRFRVAAARTGGLGGHLATVYFRRRGVELEPSSSAAHLALGTALEKLGDADGAAAAYRQAGVLAPQDAKPLVSLGTLQYELHDWPAAADTLRKALDIDSRSAAAHYQLGNVLRQQLDLPAAARAYATAFEIQPQNALACCQLAEVLRRQGLFGDALERMKQGHALGSKQPGWNLPTGQWVEQYERLVSLSAKDTDEPVTLEAAAKGIEGQLTRDDPMDVFAATAKSFRKSYTIRLEAGRAYWIDLKGEFDTYLRVEEANFLTLAFNDDMTPPTELSSRLVFTPEKDGLYRLVVASFKPGSTGTFTLTVKQAASAGKEVLLKGELKTTDTLVAGQYRKAHKVDLAGGRHYVFEMRSPRFDTLMMLVDPPGKKTLISNTRAGDFQDFSRIDFTPAEAGAYWIVVTSTKAGETGPYSLRIQGFEPAVEKK